MNPFVLRLADGSSELPASVPDRSSAEVNEHEALDAYSRVIVTVAETLGPAVVNLRAIADDGGRRGAAQGRASCSRRTAFF